MEPDEKLTINLADDKAGSPSKERTDKPSTCRRKKALVISAVIVVAIVAAYFAWNAFRYEDTDDAQKHWLSGWRKGPCRSSKCSSTGCKSRMRWTRRIAVVLYTAI
jgi:hypothetical protein